MQLCIHIQNTSFIDNISNLEKILNLKVQ
jgi:hypothetical protein